MSTHNVCLFHKEVDKSTLVVIFQITKLFDCALIGACGSNTVSYIAPKDQGSRNCQFFGLKLFL